MASAIFHIKDSYYFEVPKFLWRPHYDSLEDVPQFIRESSPPGTTLEEFEQGMSGKIVIPQPFGTLKSLYERESGFAISKFMIIELVVAALMAFTFIWLARKVRNGDAPRGKCWNLFESILVFLRDEVARPAIGGGHDHDHGHDEAAHAPAQHDAHGHATHAAHGDTHAAHAGHAAHAAHAARPHRNEADRYLPILWTIFFFILFCNLFGLVPWAGSPTASWSVTLALAAVTFLTGLIFGSIKMGVLGYWTNLVPGMDLPFVLAIFLKPMIFVIELAGTLIKHLVLSIRLLANMVAGHLVLLAILGMTTAAAAEPTGKWSIVMLISVIGSTLLSCLELFVAFLQAYVFTFLSALFIGAATHRH
jgi:F-type H+-transporting ATPase subunit a